LHFFDGHPGDLNEFTSLGLWFAWGVDYYLSCLAGINGSWGVFRLTDPPGKKTITDCKERSLFHPHPIPGEMIYRDCWRGTSDGHVREMVGANLEIMDLRNK